MSQYTTNTGPGAQPHKPGIVENLKLKAEGLVDKVTGHSHSHTGTATGTTTGTTGPGTHTGTGTGGYGGEQAYGGTTGQQGYGGQQGYAGSTPEYASQTPTGHHHTGTTGTATTPGSTGLSTTDKIKNLLPGHHKTTGTGTGYGN